MSDLETNSTKAKELLLSLYVSPILFVFQMFLTLKENMNSQTFSAIENNETSMVSDISGNKCSLLVYTTYAR